VSQSPQSPRISSTTVAAVSERDDALSALDSARRQLFGSVLAMPVLLLIAVLTPLEDVAIAGFLYCCFTFLKARRVR